MQNFQFQVRKAEKFWLLHIESQKLSQRAKFPSLVKLKPPQRNRSMFFKERLGSQDELTCCCFLWFFFLMFLIQFTELLTKLATDHVVEGVIDGLHDLPFPRGRVLLLIEDMVDIDRAVEDLRSHPLQEHGVGVLAGEVDDDGHARRPHVRPHQQRLASLALVLGRIRPDPDLVLGVGLCV